MGIDYTVKFERFQNKNETDLMSKNWMELSLSVPNDFENENITGIIPIAENRNAKTCEDCICPLQKNSGANLSWLFLVYYSSLYSWWIFKKENA